ncbi:hypothetical protein RirG_032140 [Rhizophagus irregularis DAOM 197198w]|uniref:Methyltransferase type 11 domain-containing protein n=1 Tax=Rhizophagus irregularis (strain DAOM 197198w) TaxID=1432141 RepID=A0A015LA09_RHIIW|nr:hypothetical protein RirG_032140 [Rhizophagus irregularis DAOM 197198w]
MVHFNNDPPRYSFSSLPPRYSQISFDDQKLKSSLITDISSGNPVNRLEMQHYIFKYLWQNNFSTPIAKQLQAGGAKVLEVGSAPEIWSFDMANSYPLSTFIGLNNSPTCNKSITNEPLNATVLQNNSLSSTIPFPDETFDFIYQRFFLPQLNLTSSFNPNSIFIEQYNLVKHMIRVLNPGGWIEFMIIDNLVWYNTGLYTFRLTQAYYSLTCDGYDSYNKIDEKHLYNMLVSIQQVQSIFIETKRTPLGKKGGRIGELVRKKFLLLFYFCRLR